MFEGMVGVVYYGQYYCVQLAVSMRAGRLGVRRPMILEDILVIFSSLFLLVRVSKVLQYRWIRWFNNNLVQKRFR